MTGDAIRATFCRCPLFQEIYHRVSPDDETVWHKWTVFLPVIAIEGRIAFGLCWRRRRGGPYATDKGVHAVNEPRITVIIPTRERCETLGASIRACVEQDYDNLEIIVSDNASQDDTESVVHSFRDSRLRYIKTDRPAGHDWKNDRKIEARDPRADMFRLLSFRRGGRIRYLELVV